MIDVGVVAAAVVSVKAQQSNRLFDKILLCLPIGRKTLTVSRGQTLE